MQTALLNEIPYELKMPNSVIIVLFAILFHPFPIEIPPMEFLIVLFSTVLLEVLIEIPQRQFIIVLFLIKLPPTHPELIPYQLLRI